MVPLWVRRGFRAGCAPPLLSLFLIAASADDAPAVPPGRFAYVVGSNDGAVARVDLDAGTVTSNLFAVGAGANRVAVHPDGERAAVVGSSADEVVVVDLAAESVSAVVPLPAGANPWAAAWAGDRLFVSALLLDRVYEIDAGAAAVVDSVDVGKAPEGLAVAAGRLFVANTGFDFATFSYDSGTVSVLDLDGLVPAATLAVATNPQECLATPEGLVHVICTGDFGPLAGRVDIVDPAIPAVVATLDVAGYPGGGCVLGPDVFLTVTTAAFGSEIHGYRRDTLGWSFDDGNPLLASFDFYGNLRATSQGELLVCDFSADLLLAERPDAPGSPQAWLVSDGPIDAALVEPTGPVAVVVSGLHAEDTPLGVRLGWYCTPGLGLVAGAMERSVGGEAWREAARGLPAAGAAEWTDRDAPLGRTLRYRVAVTDAAGATFRSEPVAIQRRARAADRLALRRVAPNPSRASARFELTAPRPGAARLELVDVAGRRVRTLAWNARGGEETVAWDGRDDAGSILPPGAYYARLTQGSDVAVARVLRLR